MPINLTDLSDEFDVTKILFFNVERASNFRTIYNLCAPNPKEIDFTRCDYHGDNLLTLSIKVNGALKRAEEQARMNNFIAMLGTKELLPEDFIPRVSEFFINTFSSSIDINHSNKQGDTALLLFLKNDYANRKVIEILSSKYGNALNINTPDSHGDTAFLLAISLNSFSCISAILKFYGKQLNINDFNKDGNTALLLAMKANNYKLVKNIIDRFGDKIDINHQNNDKVSAMLYAVMSEPRYIHIFYNKMNNIDFSLQNKDGNTALMLFIITCDYSITSKISKVLHGYPITMSFFISKLLKKTQFTSHEKKICLAILHAPKNIAYVLDNYKIDLNICNNNGDNVLILSIKHCLLDVFKSLYYHYKDTYGHINVNYQNKEGETLILLAIKQYQYEPKFYQILFDECSSYIDFGIKNNKGENLLLYIIENYPQEHDMVRSLLYQENIDVSVVNCDGKSVVLLCLEYCPNEFPLLLENHGRNIDFSIKRNDNSLLVEILKNHQINLSSALDAILAQ